MREQVRWAARQSQSVGEPGVGVALSRATTTRPKPLPRPHYRRQPTEAEGRLTPSWCWWWWCCRRRPGR